VCTVGKSELRYQLRSRFDMYIPPRMEALGLAEVEH